MLNTRNILTKSGLGQPASTPKQNQQQEVEPTRAKTERLLESVPDDESIDQTLQSLHSHELVLYPRHNLPEKSGSLIGCNHEIDQVLREWETSRPIVVIQGDADSGKTRLALEIAYACLQKPCGVSRSPGDLQRLVRFNHVVWIGAHENSEKKPLVAKVLDSICMVTDFPSLCRRDLARKKDGVSLILRAYSVLVVIDGLEAVDDRRLIDWMMQAPQPTKFLVTSRRHPLPIQEVCEIRLTQWEPATDLKSRR